MSFILGAVQGLTIRLRAGRGAGAEFILTRPISLQNSEADLRTLSMRKEGRDHKKVGNHCCCNIAAPIFLSIVMNVSFWNPLSRSPMNFYHRFSNSLVKSALKTFHV